MKVLSTATTISQAFKNAGRVTEILTVLSKHGYLDLIHRVKLTRFLPAKMKESPRYQNLPAAERLRLAFEQLGPTFVKLGQLLASRPDLVPQNFVDEFEKLQDNVPGVPFREVRALIESELKRPLTEVFSSFEETPMAAASIAQVHGAVLLSGESVAVKVQRPGIARLIQNDFSILRGLALLLENYIPESKPLNPTGLVEEFVRSILYELDFHVEANNIRRIGKNMEIFPKVAIPVVHVAVSTARVLVLERFTGVRFSDRDAILAQGFKPNEIVELGARVFFHMVMHDGIFHGDLHGGNLFILPDGRIGFIDFGIVGRLSRRVQDAIIAMFVALVDEDYETLASEYVNLGHSAQVINLSHLQKDLMDSISPYVGMPLGEVNVGRLLLQSTTIAARHSLEVPRELMLLFKAILTIEALGKKLEPTFDIMEVGGKLARQVITSRYSRDRILHDLLLVGRDVHVLAETFPRQLRRFLRTWSQNGFAFEVRNKDTASLAQAVTQLTYFAVVSAMALGAFAVGITLLIMDRGPEIFGLSIWGELWITAATLLLVHAMWRLRKGKR